MGTTENHPTTQEVNVSGKGSRPRPCSVDQKTFGDNWDRIFGNPQTRHDTQVKDKASALIQQRLANETERLHRMRDSRSEGEKQEAAWLKDDLAETESIGNQMKEL